METENDNSMDTIDCSDQKRQQDPLYNELVLYFNSFESLTILETLFKFLRVSDLKSARLVCNLWNEMARPRFSETSVVKLDENISLQSLRLNKFLQEFDCIPASDVCFHNYKLVLWGIEPTPRILSFWEKYGPTMRSLEVNWGRFGGTDIMRKVLFTWTPNLRRLVLKDCSFYESGILEEGGSRSSCPTKVAQIVATDRDVVVNYNLTSLSFYGGEPHVHPPITWNEMFIAYPNLKQLVIYNLNPNETSPILDVVKEIRQNDPTKLAIEKLNIFNGDYPVEEIPEEILLKLINLKLPLVHLEIDIGAHCNEMLISRLLDQHARHLREMTIYRGPLGSPLFKFPYEIMFPKLTKLEITETVADTFDFIQYTPKLTDLLVCEPPDVEPPFLVTDMMFKSNYDFHTFPLNLRYLRIDYDCGSGDVRKVVHWFPSVKSVKMYLDTEAFRTVCGEWPDLEELEVLGDKLDDEGIVGMRCKKENGKDIVIRNPLCILNLKGLKTFIMTNFGMTTTLTDLSVTHGFKKLNSLTHLELCSRSITRETWKVLRNLPQLKTLIPTDGRWQSNCEEFKKGH